MSENLEEIALNGSLEQMASILKKHNYKYISKPDVLAFLTECYNNNDIQFIEMVNNTTFAYKVELHKQRKLNNLTTQNNEQSRVG